MHMLKPAEAGDKAFIIGLFKLRMAGKELALPPVAYVSGSGIKVVLIF